MADGSTGVHLTPMELLRRLAALVPPPGFHPVGYQGVFAAHSTHRPLIVPQPPTEAAEPPDALIDGFSVGPPQADEDPELRSSFTLVPPLIPTDNHTGCGIGSGALSLSLNQKSADAFILGGGLASILLS